MRSCDRSRGLRQQCFGAWYVYVAVAAIANTCTVFSCRFCSHLMLVVLLSLGPRLEASHSSLSGATSAAASSQCPSVCPRQGWDNEAGTARPGRQGQENKDGKTRAWTARSGTASSRTARSRTPRPGHQGHENNATKTMAGGQVGKAGSTKARPMVRFLAELLGMQPQEFCFGR